MRCPICEKPTETAFRPFCSRRCADIDLAKWFSESYAVASQDPVDQEVLAQHLIEQESQKPH